MGSVCQTNPASSRRFSPRKESRPKQQVSQNQGTAGAANPGTNVLRPEFNYKNACRRCQLFWATTVATGRLILQSGGPKMESGTSCQAHQPELQLSIQINLDSEIGILFVNLNTRIAKLRPRPG
jgi:hypothetical protein